MDFYNLSADSTDTEEIINNNNYNQIYFGLNNQSFNPYKEIVNQQVIPSNYDFINLYDTSNLNAITLDEYQLNNNYNYVQNIEGLNYIPQIDNEFGNINYYPINNINNYSYSLNNNIIDVNSNNYNNFFNENSNKLILQLIPQEERQTIQLKSENKTEKEYDKNTKQENINKSENKNKDSNFRNSSILKYFEEDSFSQDNWKYFYNLNDPFFNYNDNTNTINTKITNNAQDNPDITETYIGEVNQDGEKHGFGKLIRPEVKKIGKWRHNEFTGWGREIFETGKIFEGKYIKGKLNGKGIYKNGKNLYFGEFRDSIKHGKGELFTENYHYRGNFNNGKFDGKGIVDIYNEGIYEGTFHDGEITGYGIYKWLNGDFYEGEIIDGLKHGYGVLHCANGDIYEGEFKEGKMDGNFKIIYGNGKIYKGIFVKGQPVE